MFADKNLGGGIEMWRRLFTAVDCAMSACYSHVQYLDFFFRSACHLSREVIILPRQRGKFESERMQEKKRSERLVLTATR